MSSLSQISNSLLSVRAGQYGRSVAAGGNTTLTVASQLFITSHVVEVAFQVSQVVPSSYRFWFTPLFYVTPIFLGILKAKPLFCRSIQNVILFFHKNLGTLYQIITCTYAIGLLALGYTALGLPVLAILSLGFLDGNGWIPLRMRQALHRYIYPLVVLFGLFYGNIPSRVISFLTLFSAATNWYIQRECRRVAQPLLEHNLHLNKGEIEALIKEKLPGRIEVNRDFIHHAVCPPAPDCDIEKLCEKFALISHDWTREDYDSVRQQLVQSEKFFASYGNPAGVDDERIRAILTKDLGELIRKLKSKRILEGEPADYTELHRQMQFITDYVLLHEESKKVEVASILSRLAVHSTYCGAGIFEAIQIEYGGVYYGTRVRISWRDKVLLCLRKDRIRQLQGAYLTMIESLHPYIQKILALYDIQDVHNFNFFLNLFSSYRFGINNKETENDPVAAVDPLSRLVMFYMSKKFEQAFWQDNDEKALGEVLQENMRGSEIPKVEFYDFLTEWINRQNLDAQEKAELIDELRGIPPQLFGESIEEDNGKIKDVFLRLLLLDLGILRIAPPS